MKICKLCDMEVEEGEETNHITDEHATLVDEELQEYISKAEREIIRQCFE